MTFAPSNINIGHVTFTPGNIAELEVEKVRRKIIGPISEMEQTKYSEQSVKLSCKDFFLARFFI